MGEEKTTKSDNELADRVASNPIHAYKMMKRFTVDWKSLENDLKSEEWNGNT
jgi:hypothetical protein